MGKYINKTEHGPIGSSFKEKCTSLIKAGAVIIPKPDNFEDNLVCVVDNGPFAAAAYLYSPVELSDFSVATDKRPKLFFTWDKVKEYAQ